MLILLGGITAGKKMSYKRLEIGKARRSGEGEGKANLFLRTKLRLCTKALNCPGRIL